MGGSGKPTQDAVPPDSNPLIARQSRAWTLGGEDDL